MPRAFQAAEDDDWTRPTDPTVLAVADLLRKRCGWPVGVVSHRRTDSLAASVVKLVRESLDNPGEAP